MTKREEAAPDRGRNKGDGLWRVSFFLLDLSETMDGQQSLNFWELSRRVVELMFKYPGRQFIAAIVHFAEIPRLEPEVKLLEVRMPPQSFKEISHGK